MSTPTIASEAARHFGRKSGPKAVTMASAFGDRFAARALELGAGKQTITWPSVRFQKDPQAFANEILGVQLWARQIEILEAIRDNKRVAVSGGRKIGKDFVVAVAALWWFCSFADARVIMTAKTARQIDHILWRDVRKLFLRSGQCVACKEAGVEKRPCDHSAIITGDLRELARSGLKADFREITGHTASEPEAMAGVSGARLLYLIDEASGVSDEIHAAIRGNLASGHSREVMISNPTKASGQFYDAFHSKSEFYKKIQVSSEESPNVISGEDTVPGLASREWLEEQKREWGAESPLYQIHVQGKFVVNEDGKILSVHDINQAESRWFEMSDHTGDLQIGIDPAGEGGKGDETAMAVRRGQKILGVYRWRGLSPESHLAHALGLLKQFRKPRELAPTIAIDRDGPIGNVVYGAFANYAHQHDGVFELAGVRSSEWAQRDKRNYVRVRDELYASMRQWIREGGAIPTDVKLSKDLNAAEFKEDSRSRMFASSKDELRKILGRSPDSGDAVMLACFVPGRNAAQSMMDLAGDDDDDGHLHDADRTFDPYQGTGIDAYGGRR